MLRLSVVGMLLLRVCLPCIYLLGDWCTGSQSANPLFFCAEEMVDAEAEGGGQAAVSEGMPALYLLVTLWGTAVLFLSGLMCLYGMLALQFCGSFPLEYNCEAC